MKRLAVRELLTPEQVADYLQLRKDTVYKYIRESKLAAVKLGRQYRVSIEDLDSFLMANSTRPDVRRVLFDRVLAIGERNREIVAEEVERDAAAAVAHARDGRR